MAIIAADLYETNEISLRNHIRGCLSNQDVIDLNTGTDSYCTYFLRKQFYLSVSDISSYAKQICESIIEIINKRSMLENIQEYDFTGMIANIIRPKLKLKQADPVETDRVTNRCILQ